MALGLTDRATGRADRVHAAIARNLADGDGRLALNEALKAVQSEAAKVRRRRQGDANLIDAEVAGWLAELAASLHGYKPHRPPRCPKMPGPDQMTAAYDQARIAYRGGTQT